MNHDATPAAGETTHASVTKKPWTTPVLEQVEYVDTEFGSGSYAPSDTTTYTS